MYFHVITKLSVFNKQIVAFFMAKISDWFVLKLEFQKLFYKVGRFLLISFAKPNLIIINDKRRLSFINSYPTLNFYFFQSQDYIEIFKYLC